MSGSGDEPAKDEVAVPQPSGSTITVDRECLQILEAAHDICKGLGCAGIIKCGTFDFKACDWKPEQQFQRQDLFLGN
eukprot:m.199543 g.199543  ORF g.199543 m.199543 type:complete len:77 (-) comp10100_c0_seq2:4283-4513(-)